MRGNYLTSQLDIGPRVLRDSVAPCPSPPSPTWPGHRRSVSASSPESSRRAPVVEMSHPF